ncbi:MAG TPA: hypothetical protein VK157_08080 [Phycisphaerales bacterium]|nr:hypothetical protein [Phycisphaerales bacterium]
MRFWASAAIVLVAAAAHAGPFDVEGLKPEAVAMLGSDAIANDLELRRPVMVLREHGVRALLDDEHVRLLGRVGVTKRIPMPTDANVWVRLRVSADGATRDVDVLRDAAGQLLVPAEGAKQGFAMVLNDDAFAQAMLGALGFAGAITRHEDDPQAGRETRLTGPSLTPAIITLDGPTLKARFTHGGGTLEATTRKISDEAVFVRLPAKMDPRIARGLVVYVHPGAKSGVPEAMHAGLDELGFIAVAPDNVPNDRHRVDRMQLTLDAIATACERYVIDPRRIYVTGVSGGGKIASHTWACAPDVIAGVVSIVGVGSYENMKRDDGKYWRGDFEKPVGAQLKQMKAGRIVAITGSEDANQDYIRRALAIMKSDGLTVRLDDFEGMGHEMATAERFADALRWVDEPARTRREQAVTRATDVMLRMRGVKVVDVDEKAKQRAELEQVMRNAPFSEPAWEAVEVWKQSFRN